MNKKNLKISGTVIGFCSAVLIGAITVINVVGKTSDSPKNNPDMKYSAGIEIDGDIADFVPMGIGLRGDSNNDGVLNVRDASYIAAYLANSSVNSGYMSEYRDSLGYNMGDVNADGKVNVRDVSLIARFLSEKYGNPDITWNDIIG